MRDGERTAGAVALICLLVTVIWLGLFVYDTATSGPVETFDQAVASAARLDLLEVLTYVNATLLTVSAMMLFGALYVLLKAKAPLWAAMGVVFVPIYGALNLFSYVSQLTIVPRLAALRPAADIVLGQMVQAWRGSAVNVVNNLGYAVLGIPSILFGGLLAREGGLRWAGILLAVSGGACVVGIVGVAAGSELLSLGSVVGGVLFLAALVPLSAGLLRGA